MIETYDPLLDILPKDQTEKVFAQPDCEIEPCFIGFTNIYKALSQVIPKHFTVIDLGCCYNPQCYYFTEHKEYIAVDVFDCIKWCAPNCRIFTMTIDKFIQKHLFEFNLAETFAICSYVPIDPQKISPFFLNIFTYYPHGGYSFLK